MPSARMVGVGLTALFGAAHVAHPQAATWMAMAQAVPLVTRSSATATQPAHLEGYLSQPMIMARGSGAWWSAAATLDLEGLTLRRGELTLGALGEGYVDRRHPHVYAHEAVFSAQREFGPTRTSLSAGRGFVAFGSDDPMVRPFAKYPANHHLAQIPERLIAIGAIATDRFGVEGSVFNGDEPTGPTDAPRYAHFGDSWAARITARPRESLELSASFADVRSPEVAAGGGLDQEKANVAARYYATTMRSSRYVLVEWARTVDHDGDVRAPYRSMLAEAVVCRDRVTGGVRAERTQRPEEERTTDPFRTPVPPNHLGSLGTTDWTIVTGMIQAPPVTISRVRVIPFVEISGAHVERVDDRALFDPQAYYGSNVLWLASVGARIRLGHAHDRAGRYAAALPPMPGHMPDMPGMKMTRLDTALNHESMCDM